MRRVEPGPGGWPVPAKVTVAAAPVGVTLERSRLFDRLDRATTGPVTLVRAPAGWGKTILLGSWCRARTGPFAWLSVEPGDGGGRLWSYLRIALAAAGTGEASELAGPEPGSGSDAEVVTQLADELARRRVPVTLILDDLHRIDPVAAPAVGAGLDLLLRHAGSRLRLVAGVRDDRRLPLHRWRFTGGLTELHAGDLAFTEAETGELLVAHGLSPQAERIRELSRRTAGWPAALRFAVAALADTPDPDRFLAEFDGTHPVVAEYLAGEVLAGLPPHRRESLVRTALVDRFCGDLLAALSEPDAGAPADHVVALSDGGDAAWSLAGLDREVGFLFPADPDATTRRLHPMLADLLRAELRGRCIEQVRDLHRRAARWYADHDRPREALRHALAAGDERRAVDLLTVRWPELLAYGPAAPEGAGGLPGAPGGVPIGASPELALAYAAYRLGGPDLTGVGDALRAADARAGQLVGDRHARFERIFGAVELVRGYRAGDPPAAAERRLTAAAGPIGECEGAAVEAVLRTTRGARLLAGGDLAGAEPELAAGRAAAHRAQVRGPLAAASARLALIAAIRGELRLAEQLCQEAGAAGGAEPGYVELAAAVVAVYRDRPAAADAALVRLVTGAGEEADPVLGATAGWVRAQLACDRRELSAADAGLSAGRRRLAEVPGNQLLITGLLVAEVGLRLADGRPSAARDLLRADGPRAVGTPALTTGRTAPAGYAGRTAPAEDIAGVNALVRVASAAVALAGGDAGEASTLLPAWDGPAVAYRLLPVRLAAGLIEVEATWRLGDRRRAAGCLERVLELAEPDGHRWLLRRAGPGVRAALAAHLDTGTAYWSRVHELLAAAPPDSGRPTSPSTGPLPEPLTDRELTILRYLQSVLSNVEIAAELSVSVNTVKTHIRNIYRKLGSSRRREAVRRARELRLL